MAKSVIIFCVICAAFQWREGTLPVPSQQEHFTVTVCCKDGLVFFLVNCSKPNSVIPTTVVFTWSFFTACLTAFISISLYSSSIISIKSTIMIPDKLRSRSCFAISSAASKFVFKIVFSKFFFPVYFPWYLSLLSHSLALIFF